MAEFGFLVSSQKPFEATNNIKNVIIRKVTALFKNMFALNLFSVFILLKF
jgi:hypothetical protein